MPLGPRTDHPWITACIGLGSNVGDRHAHIQSAMAALASTAGMRLTAESSIIQTEPVGPVPQGPYLNAAAMVQTTLPPRAALERLLEIERAHGRDRAAEQRWGPRTLDLDLLLYGTNVIDEPGLTIPHPRLHERMFVLGPLAEVAGDMVVPTLGRSVQDLLRALKAAGPACTPKE